MKLGSEHRSGEHRLDEISEGATASDISPDHRASAVEPPVSVRCILVTGDTTHAAALHRQLRHMQHPKLVTEISLPNQLMPAIRSFHPQVLLLHIDHATIDPLDLTKNLRCYQPDLPILITTAQKDPVLASRLLRAGAQGYILQEDWQRELGRAVSLLAGGACFVSESIMQEILHHLGEFQQETSMEGVERLSDRELIVLQFIGEGHPVSRIARELHVTPRTVVTHRGNIKRKMQLTSDEALRASAQRWVSQKKTQT